MSDQAAQWHWDQGIKIAAEGVKSLFVLNGASAVAILTFVGNTKAHSPALIFSILAFALGAFCTSGSTYFGYRAQLAYGNAGQTHALPSDPQAKRHHERANTVIFFGMLLYLVGVCLATYGLVSQA